MLIYLVLLSCLTAGSFGFTLHERRQRQADVAYGEAECRRISQAVMTIEGRRNRLLRRIKIAQLESDPTLEDRSFHRYATVNGKVIDTHAGA